MVPGTILIPNTDKMTTKTTYLYLCCLYLTRMKHHTKLRSWWTNIGLGSNRFLSSSREVWSWCWN